MATKKQNPQEVSGKAEAFVLLDCHFGKAGEVVELDQVDAEMGAAHGMLDLHPDAIQAAKAK